MSFNKVIIMGHLTRDPEHIDVSSASLCKFGLASNYKTKNGEEVCFVDVAVWGKLADVCMQYLGKGKPVLVEGRLKLDQWERDGKQSSKHTIVAESVTFLGKGNSQKEEVKKKSFGSNTMGTSTMGMSRQEENHRIEDKIDNNSLDDLPF